MHVNEISTKYKRDGFVSPVSILSADEASAHRQRLEAAEKSQGPVHYKSKIHTIFKPAADLATDARILDLVEQMIGPDILLFDVTYIIKEPKTPSFVSWHQDLTYWGFADDKQVSMWVALSQANELSGCMRMVPGSHVDGMVTHVDVKGDDNVLHRGQRVRDIDENTAVTCPLEVGQASFHHGWTLHASMPNQSMDRRIGFNVQFIAPEMKQLINPHETALLVRGEDKFNNFRRDILATGNFDEDALARHNEMDRIRKETWEKAS